MVLQTVCMSSALVRVHGNDVLVCERVHGNVCERVRSVGQVLSAVPLHELRANPCAYVTAV